MKETNASTELFGETIYSYSRAQALEDGFLIDVTEMATEAGFRWPVAITHAAWQDCVAWSDDDSRRQTYQDESGRLWDVLWMAFIAIRGSAHSGTEINFQLYRVPKGGRRTKAQLTTLKLVSGPGDAGGPVVTVMLPQED